MKQETLEITVVTVEHDLFDIDTVSNLVGIHPEMITEFTRGKLVACCGTDQTGKLLFDEAGLCRLRLLSDLRLREKLSLRMIRSICHLMDRLARAEDEVRHLRNRGR